MSPHFKLMAFVFLMLTHHWLSFIESCGVSTHMEIGHIAANLLGSSGEFNHVNYSQLIWKHQDAFQAGNTYPDTYYSNVCLLGKYHQVSEDTHWTPFTNVTIQYIRDNLPQPWDEEAEKLVVFLLGFVSHQVADISWHSLGIDQGFIKTMSYMDFHGDYSSAHTAADFGADVINEYRGDYDYLNYAQWYIPIVHLNNIYKIYYGTSDQMNEDVIDECTSLIFLAVLGEKLAVSKLYPRTAKSSPFITQQLDKYFLGGMYDMALWTVKIWYNIIYLLQNGFSEACSTPENPLYIRCNYSQPLSKYTGSALRPSDQLMNYKLPRDSILKYKTKYGVILRPKDHVLKEFIRREELSSQSKLGVNQTRSKDQKAQSVISSNQSYSQFSQAMISGDVNNDGLDDLIVSAPLYRHEGIESPCQSDYQGAVFILYGSSVDFPAGNHSIHLLSNQTIYGPNCLTGRFGESLALLDFDLDGYQDLVVSAPETGWDALNYTGSLYIYLGSSSGVYNTQPVILNASLIYSNMGIKLHTADIDLDGHDDLIIGSPMYSAKDSNQCGSVCILFSQKGLKEFLHYKPNIKCLSNSVNGSAAYSWFGSSMEVARNGSLGPVLIVGAPTYRRCYLKSCDYTQNDTQSVGQVTFWRLPDLKLMLTLEGSLEHQHLGSSLSVSDKDDLLVLGMDTADVSGKLVDVPYEIYQAGGVALYRLSELKPSAHLNKPFSTLYGNRRYSLFGHHVNIADIDGDASNELLISAPEFTMDVSEEIMAGEQGQLLVFSLQNLPLNNTGKEVCGDELIQPCPQKLAKYFFTGTEAKAQFGSSFSILRKPMSRRWSDTDGQAGYMAVGSLRSSEYGGKRSGIVSMYPL